MYYIVSARLKPDVAGEFLQKLTDGTIQDQKPDGEEIVESMQRARVSQEGEVRWSEECYCDTPLAHERETVYDHYFDGMQTEEVEDHLPFGGEPFMDVLEREAAGGGGA